jgi:hypothetical protein
MSKRHPPDWPPPTPVPPGPFTTYDPFIEFRRLAHETGRPHKQQPSRRASRFAGLALGNAALIAVGCVLAAVFVLFLVVLVRNG